MRIIALLSVLLFSLNTFAFRVESGWNDFFEKEVLLKCKVGDYSCEDFCGKTKECKITEEFCRDCIGTSVYLTYIFNHIGKTIVRTEEEVSLYDFYDLVRSNKFSTLTSSSVYNHVDVFGANDLLTKFENLCFPYYDPNPVLFYEVQKVSRLLGKPKFLVCNDLGGTKIFKIGTPGSGVDLILNNESIE